MHRDATFALHPLVEHAVKQGAAVVAERGAGVRVHLEPVLGPRALYKQHTRYLCVTIDVRYTAISSPAETLLGHGLLAEGDNWCLEHVFRRKKLNQTHQSLLFTPDIYQSHSFECEEKWMLTKTLHYSE